MGRTRMSEDDIKRDVIIVIEIYCMASIDIEKQVVKELPAATAESVKPKSWISVDGEVVGAAPDAAIPREKEGNTDSSISLTKYLPPQAEQQQDTPVAVDAAPDAAIPGENQGNTASSSHADSSISLTNYLPAASA